MPRLDFTTVNVLCDIGTNHAGDRSTCARLMSSIRQCGGIPKVQLYDETTFRRKWARQLLTDGLGFVPSVFKPDDVDWVMAFEPLALKIASVEATYKQLLDKCMSTNLPLIVSTGGMAEDEFIELAELTQGYPEICLMHCVSQYPTQASDLNLLRLDSMAEVLDYLSHPGELGLSLHYTGNLLWQVVAVVVGMGVTQFEVHVKPAGVHKTPDASSSLLPMDVERLLDCIYDTLGILGTGRFEGADCLAVREWRKRWQLQ